MGKFHDDEDPDQYYTEQAQIETQEPQYAIEEKKVSKHASRRQKKKKTQIICDADPSLDDL